MLIIGPDTFFTYFTNNPTLRIPVKVFSEDVNQSLHAVLLRAKIISLETPITYLILTALILAITLLSAFYLLRKKQIELIWPVLLLSSLLIYPGTLSYYGVLLLFIIFQFFSRDYSTKFKPILNILVICLFYYLSSISVFATICYLSLTLFILVILSNYPELKLKFDKILIIEKDERMQTVK